MNDQEIASADSHDCAIINAGPNSTEDWVKVKAEGLSVQLLATEEEEERVQRITQTRREYDGLIASYRRRADAGEQAQEQIAREWESRHQPSKLGIGRIRWQEPAPLRNGMRTQLGRAMRHWDTQEGTLLLRVRLAEARLLPSLGAEDADEREQVNGFLAEALGLTQAVSEGWLTGFLVCWQPTGRWPRRPVSVRLFWPGGKAQGESIVGPYGPLLEQLVTETGRRPWTHMAGDRRIGGPAPLPPRW